MYLFRDVSLELSGTLCECVLSVCVWWFWLRSELNPLLLWVVILLWEGLIIEFHVQLMVDASRDIL